MRVGRLAITHGETKWEVDLPAGVATIGRYYEGSSNTIHLPGDDLAISRVHAEIENMGRGFVLRNRSGNGTLVNGQLVQQIELNAGDRIRIGSAEIAFFVDDVQQVEPEPQVRPAAGVRLGTPVDASSGAAAVAARPDDGATEAFDSEALRKMELSAEQRQVIAAAKSSLASSGLSADIVLIPTGESEIVAPKVNVGYGMKASAQEAARARAKSQIKEKPQQEGTRPVVVIAAAVAALVLLLLMVVSPSDGGGGSSTIEQSEGLTEAYRVWLGERNDPTVNIDARVAEVQRRMQAIAWAERIGRTGDVREELQMLLQMDSDRSSPVFQYAASRLQGL